MDDLEQTDVKTTLLVRDILYNLVKTIESGDNPNIERGNRKRKLENVGKKEKERKKQKKPNEMVKLRRKYAAQRKMKPKTWDEAKAKCRRDLAADPPPAHVDMSTQANCDGKMINYQIQALRSMTEEDKTYNRRSMSKAVRELSVYVTNREYSDSIKKAVKILEFRMLLDQFEPPSGGLIPLLVPEVPDEILSRIIDRLMTASEPGKKHDTFNMVFALEKLSNFIKDYRLSVIRSSLVETVMKVMLRIYKNVTRKVAEHGNPDLRICLDKEYRRLLESLGKCGHKGCEWYKEFCTFLGSDELKTDLGVNEANKRCLLK